MQSKEAPEECPSTMLQGGDKSEHLSESSEFHKAILEGNFTRMKLLLASDQNVINCTSEQGMLPLHQACFRGHADIVDYLLKNGADVNAQDKQHGYTALMFAGIRGNLQVAELLLQRGARINYVNKVGRTAAQMSAFVAEEMDSYISPDASERIRLHPNAAALLYRFIIGTNLNPVKLLMSMDVMSNDDTDDSVSPTAGSLLSSNWRAAVHVLEDLLEKYFNPHQTHEALAIKFHLIACCLRKVGEYMDKDNSAIQPKCDSDVTTNNNSSAQKKSIAKSTSPISSLIRDFLRGGDPHGLSIGLERFLRKSITSFPHTESTLWRHLVSQVTKVRPGSSPTALTLVEGAVNGQGVGMMSMAEEGDCNSCTTCSDVTDNQSVEIKLCQKCKETGYCSVRCQRLHWFTHKKYCPILKAHHDWCEKSQREAKAKAIATAP